MSVWLSQYIRIVLIVILLSLGGSKLLLPSSAPVHAIDPVLEISEQSLVFWISIVEIVLGLIIWIRPSLAAYAVCGWLGVLFVIHKCIALIVEPGYACPCLGSGYTVLGLSRSAANLISLALATALIGCSVLMLVHRACFIGAGRRRTKDCLKAAESENPNVQLATSAVGRATPEGGILSEFSKEPNEEWKRFGN
jgi:hypothetical protein